MPIIDWYGDSFTYGYDGAQGGGRVPSPVPQSVAALLPQYTIRNEGVNSSGTTKMLAGTDGVHPAWTTQMANSNADIVIIAYCLNDANSISTSQYSTNLTSMYNTAVAAGKTVVFETCHKVDPSKGDPSAHAGVMRNLALSLGIGCIDLFQWSTIYFTNTQLFYTPDGYHPNQPTYTMIAQYIARILPDRIAAQPAPSGLNAALYQLTFKDEFAGGYTNVDAQGLDTDNWAARLYNTSDHSTKNYSVASGALKLWPATGFVQRDVSSDPSLLTGGFEQKYGYIEVSAKLPTSKGVVPKIALLNHDDNSGTYVPEIDVVVAYPGDMAYKRTGYWGDTSNKPVRYQMSVHPDKAPYTAASNAIQESFFGLHLASQIAEGYPEIGFATQRTWDAWINVIPARPGVSWADLNPSSGTYTWDNLDALVADTAAHPGVDIIYAFGYVPTWVTGSATNAPTDAAWTAFVTAIVARYKDTIKYWDLWNEPNATNFWTGTTAQMVNMARLAAPIIRNAGGIVLSPSPQGTSAHTWLDGFFAAGGGQYVDVVNFHGYLFTNPEAITTLIDNVKATMATHSQSSKQLWDTEHSWGTTSDTFGANDTQRAAYVGRFLTLEAAKGISRTVWYAYENDTWGTLYDKTANVLKQAGIAHRIVRQWLLNNVVGTPVVAGTLYRVPVTKPDGTTGEIVWCGSSSVSATTTYTIPSGFVNQLNLDGTSSIVTPGTVVTVNLTPRFYCAASVLEYSTGTDLSAASHTYGVSYLPTGVQFYFDGSPISGLIPKVMRSGFDKAMLDFQVGFGGASGTPDGTTTTGSSNPLQIDYVRCWQHIDYALIPNATTGNPTPVSQLVIADRVKETTTDTGTSDLSLAGALIGYQPFLNVCNVGDTFYGCIEAVDAFGSPTGSWEVGLYTYAAGNKVRRSTVLRSSNGGGAVNFSAGTKYVYLDLAASYAKTLKQLVQTGGGTPSTGGGTTTPPTNARPYIINTSGTVIDTSATYGSIIFADEFTGSNVNTNVWRQNMHPGARVNYDTATYTDTGGVVRSVLRMWAQQDSTLANFTSGSGSDPQNQFYRNELSSVGPGGFQMTSGFLEFRAKLARGKGLFPALWLFEDAGQREIDIMEAYGTADGYYANSNYQFTDWVYTLWHVGGGVGDYRLNGSGEKWKDIVNGGFPSTTPFSGTWHTWGFHWDATNVKLYFDGRLFSTVAHNGWYNQPMYIIIDGWYGFVGHTAGVPDPVNTPQGAANAMEIDWVRCWALK